LAAQCPLQVTLSATGINLRMPAAAKSNLVPKKQGICRVELLITR